MEELFPLESKWYVAMSAGLVVCIMLLRLYRSLPIQNLVVISAALLAGEAAIEWFVVKVGRIEMSDPVWHYLGGAALLWMAVVLSSRRWSKMVMRPWRQKKYFGLWVIIWTTLLTAVFQFGWPCLDPDFIALKKAPIFALKMTGVRVGGTVLLLVVFSSWFYRKRSVQPVEPSVFAHQVKNETQQSAGQ